tara:strand:+ start:349 stop:471 length:123 start_codon:yes stop_codon:yes gene_type:complete
MLILYLAGNRRFVGGTEYEEVSRPILNLMRRFRKGITFKD